MDKQSPADEAISAARAQVILHKYEKLNAPTAVLERQKNIAEERYAKLSPEAREYYPAALEYQKTITQKEEEFEASIFGRFKEALDDLDAFLDGAVSEVDTSPFTGADDKSFFDTASNAALNVHWQEFVDNLGKDPQKAVENLWEIISYARGEYIHMQVPSLEEFISEST